MQFSVLMSVYKNDDPEYLRIALDSILSQSVKPTEIVIVEDGPLNDGLYKVLQEYNDLIRRVKCSENLGLGKALNRGLKECNYELVARMDADDISVNNRFELQIGLFAKYENLQLCGGQIIEFDESVSNIIGHRIVPCSFESIKIYSKKRNPFNHVTVMFKKRAVENVGGYEHMLFFEDYWLWIRMLNNNYLSMNLSDVLCFVRTGKGMIARRGGLEYAKQIIKFESSMLRNGYINILEFVNISLIRCCIAIVPFKMREMIYHFFLHR